MNLRFGMTRITGLALGLVAGSALIAQTNTGSLTGAVKDQSGKPVAGARVIVNSPALFSPRETMTDEKGEWRAPLLPVGTYSITITKEGMAAGAKDIRIGIGVALRQDLTLKRPVERAEALVEVVAVAADVDKTNTKTASNYSAEQLQSLAVGDRGFSGAADLTPGVSTGRSGGVTFSVRGGQTAHTTFRVNGADIKDDVQGEQTGTYYIEDNIEDVQVILSPLNARNGRNLSGAVNVVTKSGGNEFRGSLRATIDRNSWEARRPSTLDSDYADDNLNKEYQLTFSGPIWKDRIWFSLGTILRPKEAWAMNTGDNFYYSNSVSLTGNPNTDGVLLAGPAGYRYTEFDQNVPFTTISDYKYYEGKVTAGITPDHTLEVNYIWSDWSFSPWNSYGGSTIRIASLGEQLSEYRTLGFNYRGVLSSNTFLEARYTRVDANNYWSKGDPLYYDQGFTGWVTAGNTDWAGSTWANGWWEGGYGFGYALSPNPNRRNNRSGNINLKLFRDFAGSHEIDFGVDYYDALLGTNEQNGPKNQWIYVGGAYESISSPGNYLFPAVNFTGTRNNGQWDDVGPAPVVWRYVGQDGMHSNKNESLYFNDTWTINSHWNLMVGLRYDRFKVTDTDGRQIASQGDLSPRLMVRYDPLGDSKHIFSATAARFGGDFISSFTQQFIKSATSAGGAFGWTGNPVNPGDPADPLGLYGVRFVTSQQLADPGNYGRPFSFFDNSKNRLFREALKVPTMDELTLSYRRGFEDGSFVKITGVHRKWNRQWARAEDYAADQMLTLEDPFGGPLDPRQAQKNWYFNSDDLTRKYNGLELEWMSKISSVWSVAGNWTYSRLVGNDNGGDTSGETYNFRNNASNALYYNRRHLTGVMGLTDEVLAPEGPLLGNQTNRIRLTATATLPLGRGQISYSWLLRYGSGMNWSSSAAAPIIGLANLPDPAPEAPTTYTKFYGGRGQYQDNDTYTVDFKLAFSVPLGLGTVQLMGDVQVNNLLNQNMPTYLARAFHGANTPRNYLTVLSPADFGTTRPGQGIDNHWMAGRSARASIGLRF